MAQEVSGTIIVAHAGLRRWGRGKTIAEARRNAGVTLRDFPEAVVYYCPDPETYISESDNLVYAAGKAPEVLSPV